MVAVAGLLPGSTGAAPADAFAVRDPGPVLWVLTGVGWLAVLALAVVPGGHIAHPAGAAAVLSGGLSSAGAVEVLAAFLGGWLVMLAAMMLPTTVPFARMFAVVSTRQPGRAPVQTVFFAAYVVLWLLFAVVGLGLAVALHPLSVRVAPDLVLATVLALAGVFQFSSLKKRCLTICREPAAFLYSHYRRGLGGAWRLGWRHALSCLGCCWALMLVMFAGSVGSLVVMLGLTAIMVVEKTTRWGARIGWWVGVGLLAAAALFAINAGGTSADHHMSMSMSAPMR